MTTGSQDEEHLRLLSMFHYIVGGVAGLLACLPFIHVVVGAVFLFAPQSMQGGGNPMPPGMPKLMGLMFVLFGGLAIILGWALAGFLIYAGRCLAQRRRHLLCMVVAGVSCLFFPFGTALGVFDLIVLSRPSVKALFQ